MERILLVEDNLDAMLAITQGLNDEGLAVECAASLSEARRAMLQNAIRLVILDVGLAGLEEPHGVEDLRRTPGFRNVPIMLIRSGPSRVPDVLQRVTPTNRGLVGWPDLLRTIQTVLT